MERINLESVSTGIETICGEIARGVELNNTVGSALANAVAQTFVDIAISMREIAQAQRDLVTIAQTDLEQYVKDSVETNLDTAVKAVISKRNPIGKAPTD